MLTITDTSKSGQLAAVRRQKGGGGSIRVGPSGDRLEDFGESVRLRIYLDARCDNLDLQKKLERFFKLRCSWPNCKKSFDPPTHPVKKIGGGAEVVTV